MITKRITLISIALLADLYFGMVSAQEVTTARLQPEPLNNIEIKLNSLEKYIKTSSPGGIYSASNSLTNSRSTLDTIGFSGWQSSHFIIRPGDAMLIVFSMPSDGNIKGVNIPIYEWGTGEQELTVSIHRLAYPYGSDGIQYENSAVDGDGWLGGYDQASDESFSLWGESYDTPYGTVSNAADPLLATELGTGPEDVPPQGLIWPDRVISFVMNPYTFEDYANNGAWGNWVNLIDYGSEPKFSFREWIGVLIHYTGSGGGEDETVGLFNFEGFGIVDTWRFLKFYAGTGGTSGNGGWHIRHWLISTQLVVELTGDIPPEISNVTELRTTLSTEDREISAVITDKNYSGGPAGISEASLIYSIDKGISWSEILMTTEADTYYAAIPGQMPGTDVEWNIQATDVEGLTESTPVWNYEIFYSKRDVLFFYNADDYGDFIQDYYLYDTFLQADFWNGTWGAGSFELFENYDLIIEITGSGPSVLNNEPIAKYLDSGRGEYILTGDEWLGVQTGWTDSCYPAKSFQYKYLGIDCDHNDINYTEAGDQGGASLLLPVKNDSVGGRLYDYLGDTTKLIYDPPFNNWLDGVYPVKGTNVAFYGVSGILDEFGEPTGSDTVPTGIYRVHESGSRIVFYTFDPLGVMLNPDPLITTGLENPLIDAVKWVKGDNVSIGTEIPIPKQFSLHQNFPNPFNPITTIRYELPRFSHVRLSVYDMLGRKVAVLADTDQNPGLKQVQWNASSVPSGIYFIQMQAGDFRHVRKVMVLK